MFIVECVSFILMIIIYFCNFVTFFLIFTIFFPYYSQFLEHSKSTHPLGRVGHTREVAEVVVFLASEKASFVTGVTIPIDGGRHATCLR